MTCCNTHPAYYVTPLWIKYRIYNSRVRYGRYNRAVWRKTSTLFSLAVPSGQIILNISRCRVEWPIKRSIPARGERECNVHRRDQFDQRARKRDHSGYATGVIFTKWRSSRWFDDQGAPFGRAASESEYFRKLPRKSRAPCAAMRKGQFRLPLTSWESNRTSCRVPDPRWSALIRARGTPRRFTATRFIQTT